MSDLALTEQTTMWALDLLPQWRPLLGPDGLPLPVPLTSWESYMKRAEEDVKIIVSKWVMEFQMPLHPGTLKLSGTLSRADFDKAETFLEVGYEGQPHAYGYSTLVFPDGKTQTGYFLMEISGE